MAFCPLPVCVKCSRYMSVERVGVVLQLNARSVNGAYEQWHADTFKCPECGTEVVARYGSNPTWMHWHPTGQQNPDITVEELRYDAPV